MTCWICKERIRPNESKAARFRETKTGIQFAHYRCVQGVQAAQVSGARAAKGARMRLHEQLGGPEPDEQTKEGIEALLEEWRRAREEGADYLACPGCGHGTSDGEYCGECLSERAEYYHPDEGGEN